MGIRLLSDAARLRLRGVPRDDEGQGDRARALGVRGSDRRQDVSRARRERGPDAQELHRHAALWAGQPPGQPRAEPQQPDAGALAQGALAHDALAQGAHPRHPLAPRLRRPGGARGCRGRRGGAREGRDGITRRARRPAALVGCSRVRREGDACGRVGSRLRHGRERGHGSPHVRDGRARGRPHPGRGHECDSGAHRLMIGMIWPTDFDSCITQSSMYSN
mmetsp:Transcript_17588/g.45460  ORF Transcript_17588/g.45460 Transcript_17588/m.45460 type:complete len:220 (+) Transcript_17588:1439-2098(+)